MSVPTGYIERRKFFGRQEKVSFNFSSGQLQKAPMSMASRTNKNLKMWGGLSTMGVSTFRSAAPPQENPARAVAMLPVGAVPSMASKTGDWGGTNEAMYKALSTFAPQLMKSFQSNLYPIAKRAYDNWPVHTGKSKSEIFIEYALDGETQIAVSWGCRAPYATYIKSNKEGKESTSTWRNPSRLWIRYPGNKIVKKLWQDSMRGIK